MWNLPNAEDSHFKWFQGSLAGYLSHYAGFNFRPRSCPCLPHHLSLMLVLNTIKHRVVETNQVRLLDAFDSFPAKCPFRCRRTHTSKCRKKTSSVSSFWKCHLTQDRPTWVSDFISKKLDGMTLISIVAIIWSFDLWTQVQFTRWREENRTAPAFSTSATRGASLHNRRTELRHGPLVRFERNSHVGCKSIRDRSMEQ